MTEQPRRGLYYSWAVMLVVIIALLPWWRNHGYLRDMFDYGLVLASNGHLDLGERPYVDFTTPIQAGFLGLNWMIERVGGGTYLALSLGGAGLIVLSALLLTLMLARRWPWWAAVVVGCSVTVAGPSQHTILWHNSLGIFCLALVTWAAACAPVLRRTAWPWHALLLAGLFLGGINKLNFHLVAVAAALAWAVRAGLLRSAGWNRVAATGLAILLVGLVLPVASELVWTGASLKLWLANVVQLASASRLDLLRQILSPVFWLRPIHDYYGLLLLPQWGLVGALLSLATVAGCRPETTGTKTSRWDRWLVPLAVMLAGAASVALVATNFEIVCVGLAAWLVLIGSVWLGFAPTGRGVIFAGGLILPAAVLGVSAWWSAWQGQRSQFGYSNALRQEYRSADSFGPAFARLAGLRLPPDIMMSLEGLAKSLPAVDADGFRPVFYGPGMEFFDRFYPSRRDKGQPLWGHWGTSYGPADLARLGEKLGENGRYQAVFVTLAFDSWPSDIHQVLNKYYNNGMVGPAVRRWTRRDENAINLADSFETLALLGGNVDGRILHMDRYPLVARQISDGRKILGTEQPDGCVLLAALTQRIRGVAVVERLRGAGNGPLHADFKIIVHGAIPENVRWAAGIDLPAGQQSISVSFEAEAGGKLLEMWVGRPAIASGVFAGFRELEITHAIESTKGVPMLRPGGLAAENATPESGASLFGAIDWRPQQLVVRGEGKPGPEGLELSAGSEVWLHTDNMTGEIRGHLSRAGFAGHTPTVRVVWYKGGRLQLMQQGPVPADQPFDFHVWTAEPGGWIGILLDPKEGTASTRARVTSSTLTP